MSVFQLFLNSLVSGMLLALVAVGFNLIFYTTKVFHLAHGLFYIAGPYAQIACQAAHLPWFISWACLVVVIALLAFLVEKFIYQPLQLKANQEITLIASLGVYFLGVNLIAFIFSNGNQFIPAVSGLSIRFASLLLTSAQTIQLVVSLLLLTGILFFTRTQLFLKMRAIAGNATVATVLGVDTGSVRTIAMIMGSLLAAVAGVLQFHDTGIQPYSGMGITLSATVAVIIGGNGSLKGTIAAAVLISLLQVLTEWFFSAEWKEGLTFLLLIVVILWRTEGFVSYKMRIEEK